MRKFPALLWILVVLGAGCAAQRPTVGEPKGPKTVVFLTDGAAFRDDVLAHVGHWLRDSGYKVVSAGSRAAKHFDAESYGAVVYVAEYRVWHTPRHAIRYWKRNDRAGNIVFFFTVDNCSHLTLPLCGHLTPPLYGAHCVGLPHHHCQCDIRGVDNREERPLQPVDPPTGKSEGYEDDRQYDHERHAHARQVRIH